jgi:GTP-binding protein YchF
MCLAFYPALSYSLSRREILLEVSIIGLPKSGKTTLFNALTKGKADTESYTSPTLTPNIGVAKVPEPRLQLLSTIFTPRKITPAEIKYVDLGGTPRSYGKDDVIRGQYLNYLSTADSLIHVVQAFSIDTTIGGDNDNNPKRALASLDLELMVSDISIISRRLDRIETALKGARSMEREHYLREQALLSKIKSGLEQEIPIWKQGLTNEETKSLSNYQFLTAKPMLIIINIAEDGIGQSESIESEIRSVYAYPQFDIVVLCAKLEMELAQLSNEEAEVFRSTYGLSEPALDKVINTSYNLLGLISFFTTVSDELRVWTIPRGTTALKAAGKIHTDMEKGFIRAEVVSYSDLKKCGSIVEARKQGLLKLEGKNYTVQDGDIITFLFNT